MLLDVSRLLQNYSFALGCQNTGERGPPPAGDKTRMAPSKLLTERQLHLIVAAVVSERQRGGLGHFRDFISKRRTLPCGRGRGK